MKSVPTSFIIQYFPNQGVVFYFHLCPLLWLQHMMVDSWYGVWCTHSPSIITFLLFQLSTHISSSFSCLAILKNYNNQPTVGYDDQYRKLYDIIVSYIVLQYDQMVFPLLCVSGWLLDIKVSKFIPWWWVQVRMGLLKAGGELHKCVFIKNICFFFFKSLKFYISFFSRASL